MILDEEKYLEHYGKKGMKWGVRRQARKESRKELKGIQKKHASDYKKASKDPTFKREVKATRKRQGIDIVRLRKQEVTKKGGLTTSHISATFKNSKGERVSEDFANAVLKKAVSKNDRRQKAAVGALFVSAVVLGKAAGRL